MTSFKSFSNTRPATLWLRLALAIAAALTSWLLLIAPAQAIVTEVSGTKFGLQPRNSETVRGGLLVGERVIGEGGDPTTEWTLPKARVAESFSNKEGNPVLHSSATYLIYWDPSHAYDPEWEDLISTFAQNVGVESGTLGQVFSVDTQYTDKTNTPASYITSFLGSTVDTDPYPTSGCVNPEPLELNTFGFKTVNSCITDSQVQGELKTYIADHKLPTGMGYIYYLLTPPGVAVCLDGAATHCSNFAEGSEVGYEHSFCSYHSDINPDKVAAGDSSTILYGVLPWTAGGLGDWYLTEHDQTDEYACQDGGFNPEHPQEKAEKEPYPQEPNQKGGESEDGYYDSGLTDLIINQMAVEQQNIVTDPLLNAWQDSMHDEVSDECRNFFAGGVSGSPTPQPSTMAGTQSNTVMGSGRYFLNTAFNLASIKLGYPALPCLPGIVLEPHFSAPNPVNAGVEVGFDGGQSDVSLNTRTVFSANGAPETSYATYSWNFGDGTPEVTGYAPGTPLGDSPEASPCEAPWLSPCAESAYHAYQYGGTYNVKLTITDVGGNKADVIEPITVIGPEPPGKTESGKTGGESSGSSTGSAGGSSTSGSSTTTTGANPTPTVPPAIPAPVAAAQVVSRTLKTATRKGLVVRYSVNEQVAGHFEVLLSSTIAKRLGIVGPAATGLPAGAPPETVIARATLVTTKGGHSAVSIQFSKRTAARLRKLHSVSLTLLLAVRNASAGSPTSTTIETTTNLVA